MDGSFLSGWLLFVGAVFAGGVLTGAAVVGLAWWLS